MPARVVHSGTASCTINPTAPSAAHGTHASRRPTVWSSACGGSSARFNAAAAGTNSAAAQISAAVPVGQDQQQPHRAGDRRCPAKPDPRGVAHHGECRGGDEQQIQEQARQRRLLGLHQRRRHERAGDADRADQLAMPQRYRHARPATLQPSARSRPAAEPGRRARQRRRRRRTGPPHRPPRAPARRDPPAPAAPPRAGEAIRRRASRATPSNPASTQRVAGPSNPSIDRVSYQEHTGQQQRGGTEPDAPARRQQRFEIRSACRLLRCFSDVSQRPPVPAADTGSGMPKLGTDAGGGSGMASGTTRGAVTLRRRSSAISRSARRDEKNPTTPSTQPPTASSNSTTIQTTTSLSIAVYRSQVPR